MSVLFNHGIRYEICNRNPIQLVRQSAKRKSVPVILSANEVQRLISVLGVRERTLVLLAFGTGLRMSELFGLKWHTISTFRKMRSASLVPSCFKWLALVKRRRHRSPFHLTRVWLTHCIHGAGPRVIGRPMIGCSPAQLLVGKNHIGGSASCELLFVQRRLRSASHSTSDGTLSGTPILHC